MVLNHPEVATRDCGDCRRFVYDEDTGERLTDHRDEPVKRAKGASPPCEHPMGSCPKGHWREPRELSDENWRVWWHYQKCDATGRFPDDDTVASNAALIRSVLNQSRR